MRKCVVIVLLFLLPLCASAQANALFPAKAENGLYGYINKNAEWIVAPQWVFADHFRGNYAVVSDRERTDDDWYTEGLINKQGSLIVDCDYFFDEGYDGWCYGGIDTGNWNVWADVDGTDRFGYFDIPSGYFSPLIYDCEVCSGTDIGLVPVIYQDKDWYVRRNTGEFVIGPLSYTDFTVYPAYFTDGFTYIEEDRNTAYFLSINGSIAYPNPDYIPYPYESYYGLCPAKNKETELWGYLSMATGAIAIDAIYANADSFSYEGYACVQLPDGTYGHIDVNGDLTASGFLSDYRFSRNYAYIEAQNIIIDTDGSTIFTVPSGYRLITGNLYNYQPDDIFYITENNLIALSGPDGDGFMNLDGEWIIPPKYYFQNEDYIVGNYNLFSKGVQPMCRADGDCKCAYFDESGRQLTDFIYDEAGSFYQGGLARVWRGNQTGYINLNGEEVYMWVNNNP